MTFVRTGAATMASPGRFRSVALVKRSLPVVADDVVFLSDDRVLTVEENNEGTEIEARSLGQPEVVTWRQQVSGIFEARLSIEREAGKWCLLGWDADGRILRARGTIGGDAVEATRWTSPVDRPVWPTVVVASGNDALLVETRYDDVLNFATFFRAFSFLHPGAAVSHLWHVGQGSHKDLGISRIATDCYPSVMGGERVVCSAYDGTRTRIVSVDPATGRDQRNWHLERTVRKRRSPASRLVDGMARLDAGRIAARHARARDAARAPARARRPDDERSMAGHHHRGYRPLEDPAVSVVDVSRSSSDEQDSLTLSGRRGGGFHRSGW